jgi:CxxC-x17-CxxC domain-containing protein
MMSDEGYQDRILTCRDCGKDFTFSAGEQSFFASKGLTNAPSRCPECRAQRRGSHTNSSTSAMRPPRERSEQYEAICATCGRTTSVPFIPREDRPVYCNECFQAQRASRPPRRDDTRSYSMSSMSYSGDTGSYGGNSGNSGNSGSDGSGGNRGRDRRDSRDFGRRDSAKRGRRDDRWEERW